MKTFFNWLSKLSFREKILFYLALFFISGALLDKFVIQPFLTDLNKIDAEISSVISEIQNDFYYSSSKNKKLIEQEFETYKHFFSTPQPQDSTELSKIVQDIAIKSNVVVERNDPFTTRDSLRKIARQLNCYGDRKNILDFIYGLSTSDIFLRLDKITILPKKEDFAVNIILSLIPLQND